MQIPALTTLFVLHLPILGTFSQHDCSLTASCVLRGLRIFGQLRLRICSISDTAPAVCYGVVAFLKRFRQCVAEPFCIFWGRLRPCVAEPSLFGAPSGPWHFLGGPGRVMRICGIFGPAPAVWFGAVALWDCSDRVWRSRRIFEAYTAFFFLSERTWPSRTLIHKPVSLQTWL